MNDKRNDQPPLSRRKLLKAGVGAAGVAAMLGAGVAAANAQVTKKASHKDAGYQESPNGAKRCGTCRQFRPPSSCITVESPISENGWCRLYAGKA
ncbi:high potential iron sulfur protein [Rhodopseudomonas palustris]|jgi:anaerobic selenocysteine-containing dehydrogenase|uniref:high potential iron sulfur protein n=1 Tax=Rhodopseudomonas TaxID=1073 RepID=UPI000D1B24EC|nr:MULTISPECIES: high potential iron sulfur protein [Rhodopseudomonas]AVT74820.1 high potential iron sulfur protein [Rhodopseudomonas palustris]NEW95710.1 high potential iron sulfur protein [Rhodopseudomonas sp. BR0G17]UYO45177.1 high potential iron sulfur protein [Rhodopseudomonas palustris]